MQCRHCGAVNDPGKKSCVLCGKALEVWVETKKPEPEPEPQTEPQVSVVVKPPRDLTPEEHIRIGELIYAAYKHKEAGAIEDAILACQGALALNDASAPSHALLGSLYEAKGDIPSAIYQYEKVKLLDPGNVANLQKLDSLRKAPPSASADTSAAPGKRKVSINLDRFMPYAPTAAAALVFVILLFGGLWITNRGNKGGAAQEGTRFVQPKQGTPQTTAPVQPNGQTFYPQGQPDQGRQPFLGPGQVAPQGQNRPADQQNRGPIRTGPVQVPVPKSGVVTGSGPAVTPLPPAQQQPAPRPAQNPPPAPVITPVDEQPRPPAPHQPAPAPAPRPRPAPQPPQSSDPEERAMQLQGAGKYQEAISAYREALNRTSDSGRVHQQIAICQQRVGQKDQAIASYKSAIRSYRDQLAAGRDASEVQRNIRSCEAGIEVLTNQN